MKLSVIVPILDDERTIIATLKALRAGAPQAEIVVVDGGSVDSGAELACKRCDSIIKAPAGRARQMNAGAAISTGDVLAFVHPDTLVPHTYASDIEQALADPSVVGGSFLVQMDHRSPLMWLLAWGMNVRSRITRLASGWQAVFIRRSAFEELGGFAEIAFYEDIDISRRLKRLGRLATPANRVITPSRQWRREGVPERALKLSLIRLLFVLGVDPSLLSHQRFKRG